MYRLTTIGLNDEDLRTSEMKKTSMKYSKKARKPVLYMLNETL